MSKIFSVFADVLRFAVDRYNELNLRWTASETWVFERLFNVSASMLSEDNIDLVLTGVDTVADIYVDNTLVRSVANAHRFAL